MKQINTFRQTGRTTRMMQAAVKSDREIILVVVHSYRYGQSGYLHRILMSVAPDAKLIRQGVYQLDETRRLEFVVPESAWIKAEGRRSFACFTDHAVFDHQLAHEVHENLRELKYRSQMT